MKYFSTNLISENASFKDALFNGLAPDGGLYMPVEIPELNNNLFNSNMSYPELATEIIHPFVENEISKNTLINICESAFNFPIPLIQLDDHLQILELFHGPTFAFKDFAARFMARTMQFFMEKEKMERTVLVATSGDTGSAVANGFYNVDGIKVIILYPSGRVSKIQEHQLTTLCGNITALEIQGNFDDCQKLVKTAFLDNEIQYQRPLSSANSINIARLIPQSVYYTWAWMKANRPKNIMISVPSGNFGNLTGGLIAKRMGLPIAKFIASVNSNDIFPKYLQSGEYLPQEGKQTLSNAMDVGDPSNFERIKSLFNSEIKSISKNISSVSINDEITSETIISIFNKYNYLADPHTAVGIKGLEKICSKNEKGIVLSTAHPGKFADAIEPIIKIKVDIPAKLKKAMEKEKNSIIIPNDFEVFKSFLINNY
ncbi:MAG: threonine synthase [Candidatus Marinimicrobia bacterium]|nr:threonine synthase [Candidatus Neomarinimicrobiota bacterium]